MVLAAALGVLGVAPCVYAQGRATATLVVSVRVIRPPVPRTAMTARTEIATVERPAPAPVASVVTNTYAQPDALTVGAAPDAVTPVTPTPPGYRVYTINY
jgi:hypothetical protein